MFLRGQRHHLGLVHALLCGVLCVLSVGVLTGYRVNVSASVSRGLYRVVSLPPTLMVDMLVVLPVPPLMYPFHSRWLPLLKPVAGLAGDAVCRVQDMLLIRGTSYGAMVLTVHGQMVPQALPDGGCLIVPEGFVFLASPAPRSLDSRYLGPVPITTLTAAAVPVWTW